MPNESSCRKGELTERVKSGDFDAEEGELLKDEREQEIEVFSYVGHILVALIKTLKATLLTFLDELSSYLIPMMGDDKITEQRNICIYVFDQLAEHCGEAALKYFDTYLPFLLDWSNAENPSVRQNALYGLVLCAECGGSIFKPFVGEALPRINVVITHSNAFELLGPNYLHLPKVISVFAEEKNKKRLKQILKIKVTSQDASLENTQVHYYFATEV